MEISFTKGREENESLKAKAALHGEETEKLELHLKTRTKELSEANFEVEIL